MSGGGGVVAVLAGCVGGAVKEKESVGVQLMLPTVINFSRTILDTNIGFKVNPFETKAKIRQQRYH